MKRVKFNDVVEVRYFDKNKPPKSNKIIFNKNMRYSKLALILFVLLILLLLFNMNKNY